MDPSDRALDGRVDVAAIIATLKARWRPIIIVPLVSIAIAILYLNVTPPRYEAQMRVIAAASSAGDGLSGKLSQFGGLAAVAGVSLPDSGGSSSFKLYVEAMHSRDVAEILARDASIMHGVFVSEWDASAKQWRPPSGIIYDTSKTIKPLIGLTNRSWEAPGSARLQIWMAQEIAVAQNAKSPVVTVSVRSKDPKFAIMFLKKLNLVIDKMLRARTLLRTDDYIRYLTARMPTIVLAEQRVAIAQALSEQERIKMVASSTRPYAAELFEHPAASDRPVSPEPIKVLAIATVLGLVFGLGWAFVIPLRVRSSAFSTLRS
jgi:uncharacterized protein involved in exopolysaccharide biosynthesis